MRYEIRSASIYNNYLIGLAAAGRVPTSGKSIRQRRGRVAADRTRKRPREWPGRGAPSAPRAPPRRGRGAAGPVGRCRPGCCRPSAPVAAAAGPAGPRSRRGHRADRLRLRRRFARSDAAWATVVTLANHRTPPRTTTWSAARPSSLSRSAPRSNRGQRRPWRIRRH